MKEMLPVVLVSVLVGSGGDDGLTFEDAVRLARENPEVLAASARLEARRQADEDIGPLTQRPYLSVTPGYRLFSESDRGVEGQVSLSQGWNLADLAEARRTAAADERAVLSAEKERAILRMELRAAAAWVELKHVERDAEQVRGRVERARALHARVVDSVTRGGGLARERAEADLYLAEMQEVEIAIEAERFHAQLELAEALGRDLQAQLTTAGDAPEAPSLDALSQCRDSAPAIVLAVARVTAAASRHVETDANGAPTLTTGLMVQRESPDGWIGFVNLGVSLPGVATQARASAKVQAELAGRKSEVPAARRAAERRVALMTHRLDHARETLALYEGRLAPAARALADAERKGFEAGEVSVWALLRAEREELRIERAYLGVQTEVTLAYAQAGLFAGHCRERTP